MLQARAAGFLGLQLWSKSFPFAAASAGLGRALSSATASNIITVTKETNRDSIGASIADAVRSNGQPTLSAAGVTNITDAVKSIAVARKLLAGDKKDVHFQPTFAEDEQSAYLLLKVQPTQPAQNYEADGDEFRIRKNGKQSEKASQLAMRVRQGMKSITMRATGSGAIKNATMSACLARTLLKEDNLDLQLQPELLMVPDEREPGMELEVMRLHLRVVPAAGGAA